MTRVAAGPRRARGLLRLWILFADGLGPRSSRELFLSYRADSRCRLRSRAHDLRRQTTRGSSAPQQKSFALDGLFSNPEDHRLCAGVDSPTKILFSVPPCAASMDKVDRETGSPLKVPGRSSPADSLHNLALHHPRLERNCLSDRFHTRRGRAPADRRHLPRTARRVKRSNP